MSKIVDNDAYGKGLLSYLNGNKKTKYTVMSDVAATERWPISLFFRDYEEMPPLEKIALNACSGRVLDIGAGAGSHALWLQNRGIDVTALDLSEGATEAMRRRGVKQIIKNDFFHYDTDQPYDTLLLLMNGIGIVERVERLPLFFEKAAGLLKKGGKVIVDSSDLLYLYCNEDGEITLDLNGDYYGELSYRMDFAKYQGEWFKWLFVDQTTLSDVAQRHGFTSKQLFVDEHHHFLIEIMKV